MQRTNLWPNPDFVPSGMHVNGSGKDISAYMKDGAFFNTGADYIDLLFKACEVGVEYVCCFNIKNTSATKNIAVWSGSGSWKPTSQTTGVKTIRFVCAAADTRLGVPPGMAIDSLIVERSDTFDKASGGLPSLLQRKHHAARLSAGQVTADDAHEPVPVTALGRDIDSRMEHADAMLPAHRRRIILFPKLAQMLERHREDHRRRIIEDDLRKPADHTGIQAERHTATDVHGGCERHAERKRLRHLHLQRLRRHSGGLHQTGHTRPIQREHDALGLNGSGVMA